MDQLARFLTRRVEFSIKGQACPLIFTHRALLICQEITGINMLSVRLGSPSASLIRALVYSALRCAGAPYDQQAVGHAISRIGIKRVREKLWDAWEASMPIPDEQDDRDEKSEAPSGEDLTWTGAWALANDLGLSDDQWLDMTPRMFQALQKARLSRHQREEILIGIIASTVANFSMGAPKTPLTAQDFMIHKFPEEPVGEQIMRAMKLMPRLKKVG